MIHPREHDALHGEHSHEKSPPRLRKFPKGISAVTQFTYIHEKVMIKG